MMSTYVGSTACFSEVEILVRSRKSTFSNNHAGVKAVAEAFGYSLEELTLIPGEANMRLSCGNPTATVNLRHGEVVVDLGSGGGLELFLSSSRLGQPAKPSVST